MLGKLSGRGPTGLRPSARPYSPKCVEQEFSEVRPLNKVASDLIGGRDHPSRAKSLRDCYLATHPATHPNYLRISPFLALSLMLRLLRGVGSGAIM